MQEENTLELNYLNSGRKLYTHTIDRCAPNKCTIHNRSSHHMLEWPQNWREDRGIMELICPHGIGHTDPDETAFGGHGCDGCCVV